MAPKAKKQKNVSALFDTAFTMEDSEGREWVMKPPNKLRGMQQAVLYAGLNHLKKQKPCPTCGHRPTEGMEPKTAAAWEQLQSQEFEEVILGKFQYDAMLEAEVSASDMYWMATYCMWYWVLGEETADVLADTYAQSKHQVNADGSAIDEETAAYLDPKAPDTPQPSRNGQNTA